MTDTLPWVRFFPSAWLTGTRGIPPAATAVYITMLAMIYDHDGPIECDRKRLARYCSMTPGTFTKALDYLIAEKKLILQEDGRLWNTRAEQEIHNRHEASDRQKTKAERRWKNKGSNRGIESALATSRNLHNGKKTSGINGRQMPRDLLGIAIQSHTNKEEEISDDISKRAPIGTRVEKTAVAAYSTLARKIGLPVIRELSKTRRRKLHALLKQHGADAWAEALRKLEASDFCRGGGERGWTANFDFLVQPSSFVKLLEGQFDNRPMKPKGQAPPLDNPDSAYLQGRIEDERRKKHG